MEPLWRLLFVLYFGEAFLHPLYLMYSSFKVLATPPVAQSLSQCSPPASYVWEPSLEKYVSFRSNPMSCEASKIDCESDGGKLAELDGASMYNYLRTLSMFKSLIKLGKS